MFVAEKTVSIVAAFPKEYLSDVVTGLVTNGLVQPISLEGEEAETREIRSIYKSVVIARQKCEELCKKAGITLSTRFSPVRFASKNWLDNAKEVLREFEDLRELVELRVEEINRLMKTFEEYKRLAKTLEPLRNVDLELSKKADYFGYYAVITDEGKLRDLIRSVPEGEIIVEKLSEEKGQVGSLIIYTKAIEKELEKAMTKLNIRPLTSLPGDLPQTASKAYVKLTSIISSIEKGYKINLSEYRALLQHIYSKLIAVETALALIASARITGNFVMIKGYVDPRRIEDVKKVLRDMTNGVYTLLSEEAAEMPVIPTIVRVPKPLKPFHDLVMQYGAPLPKEIVPTAFVSITFPLIFALMFPDAGHALVIALFGLLLYLRKRSDYGLLFIYLGAAAMVTGILAGEFFGPLLGFKELLWHGHPVLESPVEAKNAGEALFRLIGLSLRVGATVIILGVVLNLMVSVIKKEYQKAILVILPKLILFGVPLSGFILFDISVPLGAIYDAAMGGAVTLYGKVIRYSFIVSVVWMLTFEAIYEKIKHKGEAKIGLSFINGFMEVFESILLLIGNTASFLRILSLALAHSGIMFGFAAMTERAFEAGPIGIPLGALAYAFGNILGIALEGIVAYAHCTRLHFYEWFTKFYSGKGRLFTPLRMPMPVIFQTQYS